MRDAPLPPTPDPPRGRRGPLFWVAVFFGAGLAPRAPGTVGTVASMALWAPVVLREVPWWVRLCAVAAVFLVGVPACDAAIRAVGREDPKEAVIDEVAGQGLTLVLALSQPLSLVAGFVLFRLFDIVKPWPVRWADRRVHGGLGVMLDDMLAGGYALLVLWVLERYVWPVIPGGAP